MKKSKKLFTKTIITAIIVLLIVSVALLLIVIKKKNDSIYTKIMEQQLADKQMQGNNGLQGYTITAAELIKDSTDVSSMSSNSKYLQSIIDEVSSSGGGNIYIPEGTYYFSSNGQNSRNYEDYAIKCKDNVKIIGAGSNTSTGTILKPYGETTYGLDMFYFNEYADSSFQNATYLTNADFSNFVINSENANGGTYNSSGKGFMINLLKDCEWDNILVENTDGTGFGMDCPINCIIKNCTAINCGKKATTSDNGASGFGIGTGYSNEEFINIDNCKAQSNKKYGFFFEHQNRFSNYYTATQSQGFSVNNCTAKDNMYDFGGAKANDVTYENCTSESTDSSVNVAGFYFELLSNKIHITNCEVNRKFSDISSYSDYYEAAIWALNNGISNGDGVNFNPDSETARAQAITFLHRLNECPGDVISYDTNAYYKSNEYSYTGYNDVSYNSTYANAVKWGEDTGILSKDTGFYPDRSCTRAEFVTMLWRYAGKPSTTTINSFSDVPSDAWYYNSVNWAVSENLLDSTTGTFSPNTAYTRKEVIKILYKYNNNSNTSNITYNLGNGNISSSNPTTYVSKQYTIYLNNPSRTGYIFAGWTGSNGSTPQTSVGIYTNETGNKVYTANWTPNNYTVSFNSNGGNGQMNTESFLYDNPQALSDNTFIRTGYNFKNWNTDMYGNGTSYGNKQVLKNLSTISAYNLNLYAQWDVVNYSISYNLNGGIATNNPTNYTIETNSFTLNNPTRTGYTFTGWTGSNGTTPQTSVTIYNGTTGNLNYVANWQEEVVQEKNPNLTVSYNVGTTTVIVTVQSDKQMQEKNGWSLSSDKLTFTKTYIANTNEQVTFKDTSGKEATVNIIITSFSTTPTDPTPSTNTTNTTTNTITPTNTTNTTTNTVTPTNTTNTTTNTVTPTNTIDPTPTDPTNPTVENVTVQVNHKKENLDGTYTIANTQSIVVNKNAQVTPQVNTYEGFDSPNAKTITASSNGINVDYYYTRKSFKLTVLSGNGIESTTGSGTYKYEQNVTATAILKNGYENITWTGDKNTNSFSMPAKEITITAMATPKKYSISYDLGGGIGNENPLNYTIEDNFTLKNPTKNGYVFAGWTGSNGSTMQLIVNINAGTTGNLSYKANWATTGYTINYEIDSKVENNNPREYPSNTNSFTLNVPIKKGYEFIGWTGSNGTVPERTVTINAGTTGNLSYKANWIIIKYTISYDLNGGNVKENPYNYTVETESFTLNAPEKENCEFIGWTGSNGTTPEKIVTIEKGTVGDLEYKANWNSNNDNTNEVNNEENVINQNAISNETTIQKDSNKENSQTKSDKTIAQTLIPKTGTPQFWIELIILIILLVAILYFINYNKYNDI